MLGGVGVGVNVGGVLPRNTIGVLGDSVGVWVCAPVP